MPSPVQRFLISLVILLLLAQNVAWAAACAGEMAGHAPAAASAEGHSHGGGSAHAAEHAVDCDEAAHSAVSCDLACAGGCSVLPVTGEQALAWASLARPLLQRTAALQQRHHDNPFRPPITQLL